MPKRMLLVLPLLLLLAAPLFADTHIPFSARDGLNIARDAALSWAPDARLVYVENDEPVAADGTAQRWGYLFHSEEKGGARSYTVRDQKILEAVDLDFELDAPPVVDQWIDSAEALKKGHDKAGAQYCREFSGRLDTMLLIRGAFHDRKPGASTWTLVYTSATEPSLFVVVDAEKGDVVRKWKG